MFFEISQAGMPSAGQAVGESAPRGAAFQKALAGEGRSSFRVRGTFVLLSRCSGISSSRSLLGKPSKKLYFQPRRVRLLAVRAANSCCRQLGCVVSQ